MSRIPECHFCATNTSLLFYNYGRIQERHYCAETTFVVVQMSLLWYNSRFPERHCAIVFRLIGFPNVTIVLFLYISLLAHFKYRVKASYIIKLHHMTYCLSGDI